MPQLMIWLIGVVGIFLLACLILWLATRIERGRAGSDRKPGIRVNSIFSGPVGTGIYEAIDDRRRARTEHRDEK